MGVGVGIFVLGGRAISLRLVFLHVELRPHWGTQFKSIDQNRCHSKGQYLGIVLFPQRPHGFSLRCGMFIWHRCMCRAASTLKNPVEKHSVEQMSCCCHSVHRVSAHDAACLYGISLFVEQRVYMCKTGVHQRLNGESYQM